MQKTAEFFFDVGSPASYLAWTQMPALCAQAGATLVYKPMLLGGVFQATGNASPATVPAKGRYMTVDLDRFAKRYGVPFRMNPHFPVNTLQLMRGVIGMQLRQPQRFESFLAAVFTALWAHGANLNDPAVTAATLVEAGFDPAPIFGLANDPAQGQHRRGGGTWRVWRAHGVRGRSHVLRSGPAGFRPASAGLSQATLIPAGGVRPVAGARVPRRIRA